MIHIVAYEICCRAFHIDNLFTLKSNMLFLILALRIYSYYVSLCDKVCIKRLAAGWWFSPGSLVSSTNKTYRHDITEILLKVVLSIITLTLHIFVVVIF